MSLLSVINLEKLLTVKEAAEYVGSSPKLIREFCRLGNLKYQRFGQSLLIRSADLEAHEE